MVVALGLVVAGAFWWWSRGAEMPAPMLVPTTRESRSGSAEASATTDERTGANAGVELGRNDAEVPPAGRRTQFVVRDSDSLAVVPGAAVYYFPPRTTPQRIADEDRLEREDRELILREAGRCAIADASGNVDVVVDPGHDVSARHDDRYGELTLDGEEVPGAPRTIWLQRDVQLVVEVVDTTGRPCPGVRVEVEARVVSRRHGEVAFEDVSEPTDAAGRVVWRHLQCRGITAAGDVLESRIDVRGAGHLEAVRRRVQIADLAQPVRLVVPRGGTVQLRMLDADGAPLANAYASLLDPEHLEMQPSDGDRERVVFTQVPLGRTWRMVARVGETRTEQLLVGPSKAEEVLQTEIVVPVRRWQVRGRILWQGQPQHGMTVRLQGAPAAFVREREAVGSDAGGGFVLRGHAPVTAQPWAIALSVTSQYEVETLLPSTRELQFGEVDLGDLTVSPGCAAEPLAVVRLLANGRDVSAIGWAQIHAEKATPGGKKRRLHLVRTVNRLGPAGIELHGAATEGPLSLSAGAPGRHAVARPIGSGASLTIELEAEVSLRTSVLLPGASCELWVVCEEREGGRAHNPVSEQWPWFSFLGMRPGRHRLEVVVANAVVHRTAPFELVAGENVWPRDGSVLDLRGVVRLVHAAVVDAATGACIEDCRWLRVAESGGEPQQAHSAPWFRASDGLGDLLVVAEGHVPARVPAPDADVRLALQPMTRVRVQRSAATETVVVRVVEDGVRDAQLREVDENPHDAERTFDADEDIELVFAPGTVLDVIATSGGVDAPARRVIVGTASPQGIELP